MIEEIIPELYRIEIPLHGNPLKFVNSYLVKGNRRFLIIDTGMNREECFNAMVTALRKLDVNLKKTDFFVTHLHADHLGLVGRLATDSSEIYFSELEAEIVNSILRDPSSYWREVIQFYIMNGSPEEEIKRIVRAHPGVRYTYWKLVDFHSLKDNDSLEVGDFKFICKLTPGHSPAHMCLYEPERKILFSGDHVLFDITPNITWWSVMDNSLEEYLKSLEKVYSLDVELVLPGHRSRWGDLRKRIEDLRDHHKRRLHEVLMVLKYGEKTAWDVASHVTWDVEYGVWEKFPPIQKWFAVGETIAHLEYLAGEGKVSKEEKSGRIVYHATV